VFEVLVKDFKAFAL